MEKPGCQPRLWFDTHKRIIAWSVPKCKISPLLGWPLYRSFGEFCCQVDLGESF
jgi:hypothetical protein